MRSPLKRWFLAAALACVLAGCSNPEATVSQARQDLKTFRAEPGEKSELAVERSLEKLAGQDQSLERAGKTAEAEHFRGILSDLRAEFQGAKVARAINDARSALKGFGNAMKEAGKSFDEAIKQITNSPEGN